MIIHLCSFMLVFVNQGSSSTIPSNFNHYDQDFLKVRLTYIRQLTRLNRSKIGDEVVQNFARYGELNTLNFLVPSVCICIVINNLC